MNFENLIGRTFQENELFEILQFEIEENFNNYLTTFVHIFFERSSQGYIKVVEILYHEDDLQLHATNKKHVEKREFFYVYFNHGHVDINLCRLDRSNPFVIIRMDRSYRQDWGHLCYADEFPSEPLTQEEIRLAFAELSGCLEDHQNYLSLKDKKSA